jgi:hypothetical protein
VEINFEILEKALDALGQFLLDQKLHYELVVIGGGGLLLLGATLRSTNDLDLVALIDNGELISADPLPTPLSQAIKDVASALNLRNDWVNSGPTDLLTLGLPEGFKERLHPSHYGGLTIHLADRFDQICFKLYAAADQGPTSKHFTDLKTLKPTQVELKTAKNWCITHDVSSEFLKSVTAAIAAIGS